MKPPKFKIRCSAIGDIMAGEVGLTAEQKKTMADLVSRENGTHPKGLRLTERMDTQLAELRYKLANPELPRGAKTYCKSWLKQYLYRRRPEIRSRYIDKGNSNEEDGFTLMAVQLKLGMVYKNEEFRENDFLTGTCDLDHAPSDTVFDNKASWSLDTFPMFEDTIPDDAYEWQIQGYAHLWGRKRGSVVYTLTDLPEHILSQELKWEKSDNDKQAKAVNYIFTKKAWDEAKQKFFPLADDFDFIEIPASERIKRFDFDYDAEKIKAIENRVIMCQNYINELWEKRVKKQN